MRSMAGALHDILAVLVIVGAAAVFALLAWAGRTH
jgi:hypothetical protein